MLSKEEKKYIQSVLEDLYRDEKALEMKKYIQHGSVSTYEHCMKVAKASYLLSKKLKWKVNTETLLRGAFLHDFYLYDWHEEKLANKIHGLTHPRKAMKNAIQYYHIPKSQQRIIRCHMWPLTFWALPMTKEAWIVCMADKYVSGKETLEGRRERKARLSK